MRLRLSFCEASSSIELEPKHAARSPSTGYREGKTTMHDAVDAPMAIGSAFSRPYRQPRRNDIRGSFNVSRPHANEDVDIHGTRHRSSLAILEVRHPRWRHRIQFSRYEII